MNVGGSGNVLVSYLTKWTPKDNQLGIWHWCVTDVSTKDPSSKKKTLRIAFQWEYGTNPTILFVRNCCSMPSPQGPNGDPTLFRVRGQRRSRRRGNPDHDNKTQRTKRSVVLRRTLWLKNGVNGMARVSKTNSRRCRADGRQAGAAPPAERAQTSTVLPPLQ